MVHVSLSGSPAHYGDGGAVPHYTTPWYGYNVELTLVALRHGTLCVGRPWDTVTYNAWGEGQV